MQTGGEPTAAGHTMKPTILVSFDFSASAERALAWAADLQTTNGAGPIQMVHAIDARPGGSGSVNVPMLLPCAPSDDEIAGLERSMVQAALRYGSVASENVVVASSRICDIILDAARSAGADLIVRAPMAARARDGLFSVAWPSTCFVMRTAPWSLFMP